MDLHFIFMKYWTQITGTHYLIGVLKTWAFAVLCWWLPIYNLCHMPNTCSLQKQKDPLKNTGCTQLGETKIKGQSIPIGQGHRLQGRSVAIFLVKGRESYMWKQKYFILLPWLFTTLSTGNESDVMQERHLKEFCMEVFQYWIKKC